MVPVSLLCLYSLTIFFPEAVFLSVKWARCPAHCAMMRIPDKAQKAHGPLADLLAPFPINPHLGEREPTHLALLKQASIYTPLALPTSTAVQPISVGQEKEVGINKLWQSSQPPNRCLQPQPLLPNTTKARGRGRASPFRMLCQRSALGPTSPSRAAGRKPLC